MKKTKTSTKVLFCVLFCAVLVISIAATSKSMVPRTVSGDSGQATPADDTEFLGGYKVFKAAEYPFSFLYQPDWQLQQAPASEIDGSLKTILLSGKSHEAIAVKVFNKPLDIEGFIKNNVAAYSSSKVQDISSVKATVSGCPGYAWVSKDRDNVIGAAVVFTNRDYLFVVHITAAGTSNVFALDDLVQSISAGCEGSTNLAFDLANLDYPCEASLLVQTCCSLTDSSTNNYPCCTTPGNCTWYCEYRISGSNSFPWYGDAYMWMYNAKYNGTKTYPTGGTIPEVGAIMVFDNGWYTYGHVAYVTGINANGSINVAEQGCDSYCTRNGSYTTTTLRSYLAGYIYADGSAPQPSYKTVSGTVGVETIIDDYGFSSTYYFQAFGPGRYYGASAYGWGTYNGGYNSWFHWTYTTSSSVCYGKWRFYNGTAGNYQIYAYIPNIHGTAPNARYYLDGTDIGGINQNSYYNAWVSIATRNLAAGYHEVILYDHVAGGAGYELAFDALKVVRR
ncbi:MAG: CHAP domain-containing protein [Acidobacteria bacterium]|jgi:surface antigen|nr:CHAP domain-containing protein [Acidobacteriota bacterium]